MTSFYTPSEKTNRKDIITGARKEFKRLLKQQADYLDEGTWVTTEKVTTIGNSNNPSNPFVTTMKDGIIDFTRLSNGNLKATLYLSHSIDKTPLTYDFSIALNPYNHTFSGVDLGADSGWRLSGSFDQKRGLLDVVESGPVSTGSSLGESVVTTWGFVNIA